MVRRQIHLAYGEFTSLRLLISSLYNMKKVGSKPFNRYWGCTTPITGIPGESVRTITTASVMFTGTRSWKAYLENPWDASLCPTTPTVSPGSNGSVKARALDGQIYARGHTLVVPASVTGNDGPLVTTVVSAGVTL